MLRLDPLLQHALLGVLAAAPEQTRRLNLEVPDALAVVVQQAEAVLLHRLLVGLLDHLEEEDEEEETQETSRS